MKGYWVGLLIVIFFFVGFLIGSYALNSSGMPARNVDLHSGTYKIVSVVEVGDDYALVVIRQEGGEPRYYRIEKQGVLNFEDILIATELVKVIENNLKYIELIS